MVLNPTCVEDLTSFYDLVSLSVIRSTVPIFHDFIAVIRIFFNAYVFSNFILDITDIG